MLFSSVIFLFYFLPPVLSLYFIPSHKWRNGFFLLASFAFYSASEGASLPALVVSIGANYLFGLWLGRQESEPAERLEGQGGLSKIYRFATSRKCVLISGICFNLGFLAVFKYTGFAVANINALLGMAGLHLPSVALAAPLGISFYTFHAISYLVDTYRHKAPVQKDPIRLAIYMAAFPKILAGPITRYADAAGELVCRTVSRENFVYGIERFVAGFAKKVLIANPLSSVADAAFAIPAGDLDAPGAWAGIICYTLQIYFDFSGYSDMAIGLGRMFGFTFPENFNFPYISQSVREFWQRWHISLSTWFRDYLYIPLGGNRRGTARNYSNLFVVFLLCGLWHGASWNFVVWGGWYGLFLVLERTRFGAFMQSAWRPLRHLYLLLVVVIGWVFFRTDSLGMAAAYLLAMSGFSGGAGSASHLALAINNEILALVPIAIAFCLPLSVLVKRRSSLPAAGASHGCSGSFCESASYGIFLGLLFLLSCMSLAGGTHKAFIYFQF